MEERTTGPRSPARVSGQRQPRTTQCGQETMEIPLECVPDAALVVGPEGRIRLVNERAEDLFGYSRQELIGKPLESLMPRRFRSRHRRHRVGYLKAPQARPMGSGLELLALRKDGSEFPVDISLSPLERGGEILAISVIRDISRQKKIEEALQQSEKRYRTLFEQSEDAVIYVQSLGGNVVDANRAAFELFGCRSLEEMVQMELPQRWVDRDECRRFQQELARKGRVKNYPVRLRKQDGTPMECTITSTALRDSEGRITTYQGVIHDVTEQRRKERELQASEARFRAIFEHAHIGIKLLDPQGHILAANKSFQEMTGYTSQQLRGRTTWEITHPADQAKHRQVHRELLEGKLGHFQLEKRFLGRDGQVLWGRSTVSLVKDESGRPQFTIDMVEDITEYKQLQDQFLQAQKMEAIGRLAGGVAHDFNNLLTGIMGYMKLALEGMDPASQEGEDVREAHRLAERAAALTKQLLAFSRKQPKQVEVLALDRVVADFEPMLRRLVAENIEILIKSRPETGYIRADLVQVEQILMNLVVNACDAMVEGGTLAIETGPVVLGREYAATNEWMQPGPYVQLTVSDTGAGMEKEVQRQIFEPFFTTKEETKGTGLGLSTVYGLVREHQGYVLVYSEPGKGSAFQVYFPAFDEKEKKQLLENQGEETVASGTETILLVEDDDAVRNLALRVLGEYGYTVLAAASAREAEKVYRERGEQIALLLSDVVMPRGGGPALYQKLTEEHPLKVLFMSGYTKTASPHADLIGSEMPYLHKPFTPIELARKVREVLDQGEAGTPPA